MREYGEDVVAVLTSDPYRLTEIRGVGFKNADRIARSLGIELDAPQRLRAGLSATCSRTPSPTATPSSCSTSSGANAGRLLGVGDPDLLESAVRTLVAEAEVVVEDGRAYRAELWEMEQRLGEALGARARAGAAPLFDEPRRPDVQVSDEQWSVVELVRTRPLVLLTGLPGAGKTHTQRVLVELARHARQARPALRPDRQGGAADARPDRPRRDDDPPCARLLAARGGFQRDEDAPLSTTTTS